MRLYTDEEYKAAKNEDTLKMQCDYCNQEYIKSKRSIYKGLLKGSTKQYCSKECQSVGQVTRVAVTCTNCNTEFTKSKSTITKNNFCSSSCAATFNNKVTPKRSPEGSCFTCKVAIAKSLKYCKDCYKEIHHADCTLKSIKYDKHHKSTAYALVRTRARAIAKKLGWYKCYNCGYDKHIEIAHIKGITDFPEDTLISVVNDINNLLPLCPNCHWEFDNNNLIL